MLFKLTESQQNKVFATTQRDFADFTLFKPLVSDKIKKAAAGGLDTKNIHLKKKFKKVFAKPKTPDEKRAVYHAETALMCSVVEVLAMTEDGLEIMKSDFHTFTEKYYNKLVKLDAALSAERLIFLFEFWKSIRVALLGLPAHKNKQRHLDISGRRAGCMHALVTGKGETKLVDCCVLIYETEGKVTAEKRPEPRTSKAKLSAKLSTEPSTEPVNKIASVPVQLVDRSEREELPPKPHPASSIALSNEQIARLTRAPLPVPVLLPEPETESESESVPEPESEHERETEPKSEPDYDTDFELDMSAFDDLCCDAAADHVRTMSPERTVLPRANTRTYSDLSLGSTTVGANSDYDRSHSPDHSASWRSVRRRVDELSHYTRLTHYTGESDDEEDESVVVVNLDYSTNFDFVQ